MNTRVIRQATTSDCLFNVLAEWCRDGADTTTRSISILSAFASGAGVAALSPLFDLFLAHGNHIEVICGIDRKGTDAEAIRRLYALQEAHHGSLRVRIFNAPSRNAIFHPKLYINERGTKLDFVVGSANMTCGGLGSNFESLLLYQNVPRKASEAHHALSIWRTFADPKHPLSREFLKPLTAKERTRLVRKLPQKSSWEKRSTRREVGDLWKPLSRVRFPHSETVQHRAKPTAALLQGNYLLMDVLSETRKTQMQLPLPVVNGFFALERRQRADVTVALWTPDGLSQPIRRPIVISEGPDRVRLMRRIEVPEIRFRERNLAILFLKLRGRRRFAYHILPRESPQYASANRLLAAHGQQGAQDRRFIIGSKGDKLWPRMQSLLPK